MAQFPKIGLLRRKRKRYFGGFAQIFFVRVALIGGIAILFVVIFVLWFRIRARKLAGTRRLAGDDGKAEIRDAKNRVFIRLGRS